MSDEAILSARLPADLLAKAKAVAKKRDETMSQVIRRALREYVESDSPKQSKKTVPDGWVVVTPPPTAAPRSDAFSLSHKLLSDFSKLSEADVRKVWHKLEHSVREHPSAKMARKVKKSP